MMLIFDPNFNQMEIYEIMLYRKVKTLLNSDSKLKSIAGSTLISLLIRSGRTMFCGYTINRESSIYLSEIRFLV